jgi:hypothetical protein
MSGDDAHVSASEKLKALDAAKPTPHPNQYASCPACDEYDFPVAAALIAALPQIVAVVEAAENPLTFKRLPILLAELEEALS